MNPASFALRKRTAMMVMTIILIGAGFIAYQKIGRLENPDFTIKTALITTTYQGASPAEVEQEITDPLEEAIQAMSQLKEVRSTSQEGLSIIYVDIKSTYKTKELPQIWDELRKKINDAQSKLPPGAGHSQVHDDFGDVYGVFFALTGEKYSKADLKKYARKLKTQLLSCDDVAKIDFWGLQQEVIYVEFKRSVLSKLGISPLMIANTIQTQNSVIPSGKVKIDDSYIRITPSGNLSSVEVIKNLYITGASPDKKLIRLGDVATVYRKYMEPPRNEMLFNGKPAIALGISTIPGGNVVNMGKSIRNKLNQIKKNQPKGMKLHTIYYQSDMVNHAVDNFVINLVMAIVIVIGLLMLFSGWETGLLIGVVLFLTICGTLVGMFVLGITLQKISLGALILALGMLVDNAIVVSDGILVRVERGENREKAAEDVVRDTQWPLLGATIVAILAFTAIGFAPGSVGEFCRSLFDVMLISLLFSWILAVTITPLLCVWFLKIPDIHGKDPYDKPMFKIYRKFLHKTICHKWITGLVTLILLLVAIFGFGFVKKSFFPGSTNPYFYINYWRPEGTHFDNTKKDLKEIDRWIRSQKGIANVSGFFGEGALRFILSYDYQNANSSYGQLLVEVTDFNRVSEFIDKTNTYLKQNYPQSESYCSDVPTGPVIPFKVEVRFFGPDKTILKQLGDKAIAIMHNEPNARDSRLDWRQQVQVLRPRFSQTQARKVGVSRADLAQSLQLNFNGLITGLYREDNEMIPIIFRPPVQERATVNNFNDVQVWSSANRTFVPIAQVVSSIKHQWEWPKIQRRDRQNVITAQCNPVTGFADALRNSLKDKIEAIKLPTGYRMEWGGEWDSSQEANEPLSKMFPLCFLAMFIIVVWLFDSIRRPLIIFMTVPLSIIGVTGALLITGLPFGFMSILGFLGLSGMLIKNAIVLIDEIELQLKRDIPPYKAILDSSVSRMRPVILAAGTTILGMLPLLTDPLYSGMAVTIMGGLFAATFLTLIIVPVTYTIVYHIKIENTYL